MNRYFSYLQTAERLATEYPKGMPLHLYLKQHFAANKKMGSRDRKIMGDLCYAYFRLKPLLDESSLSLSDQMLTAAYILGKESKIIAETLKPEWPLSSEKSAVQKLSFLLTASVADFPFFHLLSGRLNALGFCNSLLHQPAVFIRCRKGYTDRVHQKLLNSDIQFSRMGDHAFSIASGIKLEQFFRLNKELVIQDYSSQQVLDSLMDEVNDASRSNSQPVKVWDVCAASGGKSILFFDKYFGKSGVQLTVSDIRESILKNLSQRLLEAGINIHRKFCADITKNIPLGSEELFDVIICDVPCSGSGTWARTPDQYAFHSDAAIKEFSTLQKNIVLNASKHLEQNGWLMYITCSAFACENELNVQEICSSGGLQCVKDGYVEGAEYGADTMYFALLKKYN